MEREGETKVRGMEGVERKVEALAVEVKKVEDKPAETQAEV